MKRFLSTGIPIKIFAVLSILLLLALLAPMLKAAQYDVPSADDYENGYDTYVAWRDTGSITEVIKASFARIHELYFTWQGTFTAIFLFTLNPMIFGEQYYQIGPWIVIGTLLFGMFYLTFTLWGRIYQASKSECTIIAVIWAAAGTQFLPRASQGIYWYTGAIYYTFFFGLAAVAYAILIRFIDRDINDRGTGELIASCLLLFFIGGGNLVTGLTTTVVLLSIEAWLIFRKNSDWKILLIPLLCFAVSFGINIAAPGNSARQTFFAQPGLIKSVFLSFRETFRSFGKWFTIPVISLILILIPVFRNISLRTEKRFPLPGLVSLYSLCLAAVMFYAPIYAMTEQTLDHLGRITNIIFFGMLFLVIFNLFYWIGYLVQKGTLKEHFFPAAGKNRISLVFLAVMLLIFSFGMTQIKWYDTTSISAFRSYRSTQMGNYWHTYQQRLKILKDPEIKDAVLKRFPYRPYVLFFQELSTDPGHNTTIALWYGKDSVIIQ